MALFLTGEGTDYCLQYFGSYVDLFSDLLAEPGTHIDVFDNQAGEFPESFHNYDALVLTGSAADAHADEPWIHQLNDAIRRADSAGCKILGVCFGHQAIANALGGRSGRNPNGWEVGLWAMALTDAFRRLSFTKGMSQAPKILEVHQDHVIEPPPGAVVLASTRNTPVQMFAIGERVFCMQGHPEFFNEIVQDLVDARMQRGIIPGDVGQEALDSLKEKPDRDQWQAMLKAFLYGVS